MSWQSQIQTDWNGAVSIELQQMASNGKMKGYGMVSIFFKGAQPFSSPGYGPALQVCVALFEACSVLYVIMYSHHASHHIASAWAADESSIATQPKS